MLLSLSVQSFILLMISFSCIVMGVVNDSYSDFLFQIRLGDSLAPHTGFAAVTSHATLFTGTDPPGLPLRLFWFWWGTVDSSLQDSLGCEVTKKQCHLVAQRRTQKMCGLWFGVFVWVLFSPCLRGQETIKCSKQKCPCWQKLWWLLLLQLILPCIRVILRAGAGGNPLVETNLDWCWIEAAIRWCLFLSMQRKLHSLKLHVS